MNAEKEQQPTTDAVFTETADDVDTMAPVPMSEPPVRGGSLISGLALLLSLAACVAVAYLWWSVRQQVEPPETIDYAAQIRGQIDTASESLRKELTGSFDALEQRVEDSDRLIQQRLAADRAALADNLDRLQADLRRDRSGLERRLELAENSVARLAEIRLDSARSLALAEAEYLLRLANERLQLFQDPRGALKALNLAAAQLRALDDSLFNSVRQALAAEIQSLESIETPDRVAISGRLLALARSAADWPLDSRRSLQTEGHNVLEPDSMEEGWWPRLKGVLASAVTVRREQQTATVLLTLDEERLLRENLRLQLQVAQLAAVRAEQDLYRDAIALVSEWLRDYYDREAAAVGDALLTLEELAGVDLDPEIPEIANSLRLLRNMQTSFELDLEPAVESESPEEIEKL